MDCSNKKGELFPNDELGPLVLDKTGYSPEVLKTFRICPSNSEPVASWCVTCDAIPPDGWIKNISFIRAYCLQRAIIERAICEHVSEASDVISGLIHACGWERGEKFRAGRKRETGSPVRKKIQKLLQDDPSRKNPTLWEMVCNDPPRGWFAVPEPRTNVEPYIENERTAKSMGKSRFFNICGEERSKITG